MKKAAIKDKLNQFYEYLGHEKGIAIRVMAYPSIALLTHYYGGGSLQGLIADLLIEDFYKMSRPKVLIK